MIKDLVGHGPPTHVVCRPHKMGNEGRGSEQAAALSSDLMRLRVVLEPSGEGGFTALVPALPGCVSEGDTREHALANVEEAIRLYLEPVDDGVGSPDAEVVEIAV